MADYVFEERRKNYTEFTTRPNWGAIWAGAFTFFAIWSVFGVLGMAIFASAANPNSANPVSGMRAGIGVWTVVLTIIAMFVAGRVTGRLAGIANWRDGMTHGMIMFGLTVIGTLVLLSQGAVIMAAAPTGAEGGVHSAYLLTVFGDIGWAGFAALLLGWLAALGGASSGARPAGSQTPVQGARRAA